MVGADAREVFAAESTEDGDVNYTQLRGGVPAGQGAVYAHLMEVAA